MLYTTLYIFLCPGSYNTLFFCFTAHPVTGDNKRRGRFERKLASSQIASSKILLLFLLFFLVDLQWKSRECGRTIFLANRRKVTLIIDAGRKKGFLSASLTKSQIQASRVISFLKSNPTSLGFFGGVPKQEPLLLMESAKRMKTRPTCPQCGGNQVKTLGGGTHGKYRYSCQHCSANWQQVPPHRLLLTDGSDAGVAMRKRASSSRLSAPTWKRPQLILFGDSITQQSFRPGGWGARLADHYQRTADVVLRGYSGYTSRWCLQLLSTLFPSNRPAPALVTVLLGANDANLPPPLRGQPAEASRQHVPLDEYRDNLRQIVQTIKSCGDGSTRVLLITPPPCDAKAWQESMERQGKAPMGAQPNRESSVTAKYAAYCMSVGEAMEVATLDLHSLMCNAPDTDYRTLLEDGLHPNNAGEEHIFKLILGAIQRNFPELAPGKFEDGPLPLPRTLPLDYPDHKRLPTHHYELAFHEHAAQKARLLGQSETPQQIAVQLKHQVAQRVAAQGQMPALTSAAGVATLQAAGVHAAGLPIAQAAPHLSVQQVQQLPRVSVPLETERDPSPFPLPPTQPRL